MKNKYSIGCQGNQIYLLPLSGHTFIEPDSHLRNRSIGIVFNASTGQLERTYDTVNAISNRLQFHHNQIFSFSEFSGLV